MVNATQEQRRSDGPSQGTRQRKVQTPKRVKGQVPARPKAPVSVHQKALDEVRDKIETLLSHVDRNITASEAALKRGQTMMEESRLMLELAEQEGLQVDSSWFSSLEQSCKQYTATISEMNATKAELQGLQRVYREIQARVASKETKLSDHKELQDSVAQLHELIGQLAL